MAVRSIRLRERVVGLCIMRDGTRHVHTVEAGSVVTVMSFDPETDLVEVETNSLRVLLTNESLLTHGEDVGPV
jgi:hypothetical protein